MDNVRKVIVLGAGIEQVPLIEAAKKLGCFVIAISPQGNYPGLKIANKVYDIDVSDKNAIYEIAKKENIAAIVGQTDLALPTIAYIGEKLGLSIPNAGILNTITNKYNMRNIAEKVGVNTPRYKKVSNVEDALHSVKYVGYPAVIKPVDGTASIGVFKVFNDQELVVFFAESLEGSKVQEVMLEQFIEGTEYVVESLVNENELYDLCIGHRDYFKNDRYFIPSATVFVDSTCDKTNIENKVIEENNKLVNEFRLGFGLTHGEFIYNEIDEKVYLVEITVRGGGMRIASEIVELCTGINPSEFMICKSLGYSFEMKNKKRKKLAAGYFSLLLPEGKILDIKGLDKLKSISGLYKSNLEGLKVGDVISSAKNKTARKGPLLIYGNNKEACYDVLDSAKKSICINTVNKNGNIEGVLWS